MSGPSFSNIDLWLFELAEGNLTPAQVEQLELFLLQNPDLEVDRDVWEMAKVAPVTEVYPDQDALERKRRPIGWFYISSAASIALLFVSSIFNDTQLSLNEQDDKLLAENASYSIVKQRLEKEIASIRAKEINAKNNEVSPENRTVENENQNNSNSKDGFVGKEVTDNQPVINVVKTGSTASLLENNSVASTSMDYDVSNASYNSNYNSFDESGVTKHTNDVHLVRENNEIKAISNTVNKRTVSREAINTNPAEELDVLTENDYTLSTRTEREIKFSNFAATNYKKSLRSKFSSFSRAIRRMADNPIALKNFRDPYYHVPGMLPNDVNFSSTGTMLATRVQAISRMQWYGQENEQLMSQLAIDGYSYDLRGGIGIQMNHAYYKDGGVQVANVALTYSPKLSLNSSISFEPSVRFKMGNKRLNASKMNGTSTVEMNRQNAQDYYPENGTPLGNSLWYKDLGVGLMVNTEWFYIGAQVDNLFRHEDNLFSSDINNPHRAANHFVASVGTDWVNKKENLSFSPYLVYQNNANLSEAWLGANLKYNWFTIGGAISSMMDPAASIGMKFKRFALTYNADYSLSAMTNNRSLSHQVTIKFVAKPTRFGRRILNL